MKNKEYIYIFRTYTASGTLLKFGYTSDIFKRLYQYRIQNPGIEIVYIAQLQNALEIEQIFHKTNVSVFGNEWYSEETLSTMMEYLNNINHLNVTSNKKPDRETPINFKDVVLECKKGDSDYLLWAFKKYDFLHDAITLLGYDKIEQYEYNTARVKRALIPYTNKGSENNIKTLLQNYNLSKGVFISYKDLKTIFTEIYKELNILRVAKGKDIEQYYKVKSHLKIINNVRVNGVIIL